MKYLTIALCCISLFSCNKKIVQLPEIENAPVTEVLDVSPVYMFFDEETDSIEFNRKNMISTTNWLVNIDKRLTLEQVLPHLQYLQEKRHSDGMHKNENARNYFTCHDTSINNLGFIEFTDVEYIFNKSKKPKITNTEVLLEPENLTKTDSPWNLAYSCLTTEFIELNFDSKETIYLGNCFFDGKIGKIKKEKLTEYIEKLIETSSAFKANLSLNFNDNLSFQEYIQYKSLISTIENHYISVSNKEFIY